MTDTLLKASAALDRAQMAVVEAQQLVDAAIGLASAQDAVAAPTAPASPPVAPPAGTAGLSDPAAFFDVLRRSKVLGPTLEPGEVSGCEAILAACAGKMPTSWAAYALGTAFHETAGTMQPVREAYWLDETSANKYFTRMYGPEGQRGDYARKHGNTRPGDGPLFAGKGFVQLTWACNYKTAGAALGLPLYEQPHLAMDPVIAGKVLVQGLIDGWFSSTGKGIRAYIPANPTLQNFKAARVLVNLHDKDELIAGYAMTFLKALQAGGWQ